MCCVAHVLHRLDPSCRETLDTRHLWVNPTDTSNALAVTCVAGVGKGGVRSRTAVVSRHRHRHR